MNRFGCPICGYKEIEVIDEHQCTTHEICKCCGNQSGYDYDLQSTQEQIIKLRVLWIAQVKADWSGRPFGFNPYQQLRAMDMQYPKIPTIMAFYKLNLISDDYCRSWADTQLDSKYDDFDDLMLLSLKGAKHCSNLFRHQFPQPRMLTFDEELALRTHSIDFADSIEVNKYMMWVTGLYHRELPDEPIHEIVSTVDYIMDHRGAEDARSYLQERHSILLDATVKLNNELWSEIK